MNHQRYANAQALADDLHLPGTKGVGSYLKSASDLIRQRLGAGLIPVHETRSFPGNGEEMLAIDPVLSVESVTVVDDEGNESTLDTGDWVLLPLYTLWRNGPKTVLRRKDGACFSAYESVMIVGAWGLYAETATISGESVSQAIDASELAVANGTKLSEGMIVLVEDEQELVTGYGSPESATSVLNGAVSAGDTTITVDDGSEFHAGEVLLIGTERMRIELINDDDLAVTRGWDGTRESDHDDDAAIKVYRSYTVERGINGTSAAAHPEDGVGTTALAVYLVPGDVEWICRQVAGLMLKKAQSSFAGRAGGDTMGEVFYYNEIPPQFDKILDQWHILAI
ncbi:MAG: hypothetical protein HPY85_06845 [Anaerolineae bacterium]|nr:hypothetical protein [Anaerolineae bacterium]